MILSQIFTGREEAWRRFANEIGAEFIKGGLLQSDKVVAKVKEWIITLDTYTEGSWETVRFIYTRMRVPYSNKDGFKFTIYRKKDLLSFSICGIEIGRSLSQKLGKFLVRRNIEVGYPDFDNVFIIESKNESKVRALFANSRIRQLIQIQPDIYFKLSRSELYFRSEGVIDDVERLKSIFELFKETLNQLCEIGSTYETELPSVVMSGRE